MAPTPTKSAKCESEGTKPDSPDGRQDQGFRSFSRTPTRKATEASTSPSVRSGRSANQCSRPAPPGSATSPRLRNHEHHETTDGDKATQASLSSEPGAAAQQRRLAGLQRHARQRPAEYEPAVPPKGPAIGTHCPRGLPAQRDGEPDSKARKGPFRERKAGKCHGGHRLGKVRPAKRNHRR